MGKKIIGFFLTTIVLPFIIVGMVSRLVQAGLTGGWRDVDNFLEWLIRG